MHDACDRAINIIIGASSRSRTAKPSHIDRIESVPAPPNHRLQALECKLIVPASGGSILTSFWHKSGDESIPAKHAIMPQIQTRSSLPPSRSTRCCCLCPTTDDERQPASCQHTQGYYHDRCLNPHDCTTKQNRMVVVPPQQPSQQPQPPPPAKRKRRPVEVVVCPDIPAPSSAAARVRIYYARVVLSPWCCVGSMGVWMWMCGGKVYQSIHVPLMQPNRPTNRPSHHSPPSLTCAHTHAHTHTHNSKRSAAATTSPRRSWQGMGARRSAWRNGRSSSGYGSR